MWELDSKMPETFEQRIIKLLKKIPKGKVVTYGQIAAMAGNPRGARQVVRILSTCSKKEKLPWHRVINRLGQISLPLHDGYEIQKALLEAEDIKFNLNDKIDLATYQWQPK